jgi:predicted dehydrogenase
MVSKVLSGKLKVGVVGCGRMGLEHIKNLAEDDRCGPENVFIFDVNELAMESARDRYGVQIVTGLDSLLRNSEIAAVVVASSNRSHSEMAIRALDEGKHVLLEKPMALNEVDARRVVLAARRSGKILHVGFELRNSLFPRKVKAMKAELGELVSAQVVEYRGHFWPQWKGSKTDGGSMFLMETCHLIDLFRWWTESEVAEVHAVGSVKNLVPHYDFPDTQFTTLVFRDGFVGHISLCHVRSAIPSEFSYEDPLGNDCLRDEKLGHQYEYSLIGTKGAVRYLPLKGQCNLYRHELQPDGSFWQRLVPRFETMEFSDQKESIHNVKAEIGDFLDAVTGDGCGSLDPDDALKTHLVCYAAEEALRCRRPVILDDGEETLDRNSVSDDEPNQLMEPSSLEEIGLQLH